MTARVSLDFKRGRYSINGVTKTAQECIIPGGQSPFDYGDIIPGVGLRAISSWGNNGVTVQTYLTGHLTPAARAAVLADGINAGFTGVMSAITYVSGNNQAYVGILAGDNTPITQGWGFEQNWDVATGNLSNVYDFAPTETVVICPAMGLRKSAFTLSNTALSASIDGLAAMTVAPGQGTTGSTIEIQVAASTDDDGDYAIAILEKIEFFPTVEDDDLPPLSEPISDGLLDYSVRMRSWAYTLDGHKKAVWRLGPTITLEFDLTTQTWATLESPGRPNWRAHCGQNWIGMSRDTLLNGFGSDVVVGDDASGTLFILDPTIGRDDRSTTGADSFDRVVTGGLVLSGREIAPCGALQLDYSAGNPSQSGATFTLETSDDWGNTFDDQGSVTVTADDFAGVVEWRGLGTARAPGRVFRITDNGAAIRISGADLR